MEHHRGWESRLWHGLPVHYGCALEESSCLGMQLKMGGKCHLKLNIGERPIANKYREGKMKRTLERELNSTWNCWKGNAWSQSRWLEISLAFAWCIFWLMGQHQFWSPDKVSWECGIFWMCYSPWSHTVVGIEELSMPQGRVSTTISCLGCWHNGFNRPVLKHGPRSLTCLRVFGWKTHARNESKSWDPCKRGALTPGPDLLWRIRGRACMLGPERWWTMPE